MNWNQKCIRLSETLDKKQLLELVKCDPYGLLVKLPFDGQNWAKLTACYLKIADIFKRRN